MNPEQSLREGKLAEALNQLQQQVRQNPADAKLRVFLFQLLAVMGQWERAMNQLNVAGDMDSSTLSMVQTYREALRCELLRTEVFAGRRSPLVFGDPEQWLALLIQALQPYAEGHYDKAAALHEQALEAAPATAGTIDDQPFQWISDADPRLGPVLEAVVNGRYYWISFSNIHRIEFEAPTDLRDMVWLPAQFTWANGGQTVGLVPARYPGTEQSEDGLLLLARKTDWREVADDLQLGTGQRLLATDTDDYALLDTRVIVLDTLAATEAGDG